MYEQLNFKSWPFQTVPDENFARVWAGRAKTKAQLDQLIRKIQLVPRSSLRLLWANFGMGKTHTLLHIRHLCNQTGNKLIPLYAVMPNRPSSFLDVYRAIISELPFAYLGDQLVKMGNVSSGNLALNPMFSRSPGVVSALLAMRGGDLERSIVARQWLTAQPGLSARDLRAIGITSRIKTAEDAILALTSLVQLATFNLKPVGKLVILLDEYQRIGELSSSIRIQINAGIHAFFNANPTNLDLTLTFSFGRQDNVAYLLSSELKSRAAPETISLDVLTEFEAFEFLRDLFNQFRIQQDDRWAYPFSPETVKAIVARIAQEKALTPRRLMLYGDHILSEVLSNREANNTSEIALDEIASLLSNSRLGALDMDE